MARTKGDMVRKRKLEMVLEQQQIPDVPKKKERAEGRVQQEMVDVLVGKSKPPENAQIDEGRGRITDAVIELEGKTIGVTSQLDQARVISSKERKDGKFDLSSGSQKERWDELAAKMIELGQETFSKITSLQSELKAVRIAMQTEEIEFDIKLATLEKNLGSIVGDRDATLEMLTQEMWKAKFLMALCNRKGDVDRNLVAMWKNMQKLTKSEQACKMEFEEVVNKEVDVEDELVSMSFDKQQLTLCLETIMHLETTLQEVEEEKEKVLKENTSLKDELFSIREERNQLASSLKMTLRKLEEEKGKIIPGLLGIAN